MEELLQPPVIQQETDMKKAILRLFKIILCIAAAAAVAFGFFWFRYPPVTVDTSTAPNELTDVGSPYKFYFSQLDNEEKHAYNLILSEIYSMPESIAINRLEPAQADRVFEALLNDNPDLFFVGRKCSIATTSLQTTFSVEYTVEKSEYSEMKKELDEVCEKVISALSDPQNEWQTELEIHDYIIENCEYMLDENDSSYSTSYGALAGGKAACEGYSKAAKLLFDTVGIRSGVVSGKAKSEDGEVSPHMWNVVEIGGEFYHLDCTWDDPVSDDGSDSKTYFYFNLDDESISLTHSEFSYDFGCDGYTENYFVKTGAYFEEYNQACKDKIVQLIINEAETDKGSVYLRFADENVYNEAVKDLIDNEKIYELLRKAKNSTDAGFSTTATGYFEQRERYIIAFAPNYE